MRHLLVLIFMFSFSLGAHAVGGIDGGGGTGKVAIAIKDISRLNDVDWEEPHEDPTSVAMEQFRDIVVINGVTKELTLNLNKIKIAKVTDYRKPSNNPNVSRDKDPLTRFKQMAVGGDVTVMFIEFQSVKDLGNGVVVFKLKKDWGSSLKIYQITQGGKVTLENFGGGWDLKDYDPSTTVFSIDLIYIPSSLKQR